MQAKKAPDKRVTAPSPPSTTTSASVAPAAPAPDGAPAPPDGDPDDAPAEAQRRASLAEGAAPEAAVCARAPLQPARVWDRFSRVDLRWNSAECTRGARWTLCRSQSKLCQIVKSFSDRPALKLASGFEPTGCFGSEPVAVVRPNYDCHIIAAGQPPRTPTGAMQRNATEQNPSKTRRATDPAVACNPTRSHRQPPCIAAQRGGRGETCGCRDGATAKARAGGEAGEGACAVLATQLLGRSAAPVSTGKEARCLTQR